MLPLTYHLQNYFVHLEALGKATPFIYFFTDLVEEGLSILFFIYKRMGYTKGIKIGRTLHLTHLLFVDDVLLIGNGPRRMKDSNKF